MADVHEYVMPHQPKKRVETLLADAMQALWLRVYKGENEPRNVKLFACAINATWVLFTSSNESMADSATAPGTAPGTR